MTLRPPAFAVADVTWDSSESVAGMYAYPVPNRPVSIEAFRDLLGVSEILGVGAVRQPFGQAQEVEVQVLLGVDVDSPGYAENPATCVRWLGCRQLDLLAAGPRWRYGRPIGNAPASRLIAEFEFTGRSEEIGVGAHPQRETTISAWGRRRATVLEVTQRNTIGGGICLRPVVTPRSFYGTARRGREQSAEASRTSACPDQSGSSLWAVSILPRRQAIKLATAQPGLLAGTAW